MARKRRRRPFPWTAVLFVVVMAVAWTGMMFSPVTAARIVRVEGASPEDQERIKAALQPLRNVPMLRTRGLEIQSRLGEPSYVKSVTMAQNLFGRVHVSLEYHVPIARLADSVGMCLAGDGTLFQPLVDAETELPEVRLAEGLRRPQIGFFAAWSPRDTAEVAAHVKRLLPDRQVDILVELRGVLSLEIDGRSRVTLGSGDDLDLKFDKLRAIVQEDPGLVDRRVEINLTAPNRPVVRSLAES